MGWDIKCTLSEAPPYVWLLLASDAYQNSGNVTSQTFPDLPAQTYWGLSVMCQNQHSMLLYQMNDTEDRYIIIYIFHFIEEYDTEIR